MHELHNNMNCSNASRSYYVSPRDTAIYLERQGHPRLEKKPAGRARPRVADVHEQGRVVMLQGPAVPWLSANLLANFPLNNQLNLCSLLEHGDTNKAQPVTDILECSS